MINNFSETIEKVKPFIKEITNKTAIKAVDDMARSFTSSLFESDINFEDFILSYKKDEIFNPDCLFDDQSNLFDFIHSNYKSLSKVLFSLAIFVFLITKFSGLGFSLVGIFKNPILLNTDMFLSIPEK